MFGISPRSDIGPRFHRIVVSCSCKALCSGDEVVAVYVPTPASIALRFGGSFLFVVLTGSLGAYTVPDRVGVESIPGIAVLIMIGCAHFYLLYRAYYP